jgi:serine/threonine-protein kinase
VTEENPQEEARDVASDADATQSGGLRKWVRRRFFGETNAPVDTEATVTSQPHQPQVTLTLHGRALESRDVASLLGDVFPPGEQTVLPRSVGELASGGMAVIDRATDHTLRREVALKRLRPELRDHAASMRGFVREAQITGQLTHPNIVPVHVLAQDEEGVFFAMKLIEGRTLTELIQELPDRPLDTHELFDAIELILKVCDALAFAHNRGVIHCDIKPGNVMIADYGQVYLMDWGVARLKEFPDDPNSGVQLPEGDGIDSLPAAAESDSAVGTPAYMSPEQVRGKSEELDERTDVFAVGALLYAMLARRPPYRARTLFKILDRAEKCSFPPLDEVCPPGSIPSALMDIVHKAMAKLPDDRYPSIEALQLVLGEFVRGGPEFPKRRLATGDVIIEEGEEGDEAYIVESGRLQVVREVDGRRRVLVELGPGEVFGEIAILAATRRTATIVAAEPTVLRAVNAAVLERELAGMKPWMGALVRSLADRFRTSTIGASLPPSRRVARWLGAYAMAFGEGEPGAPTRSVSLKAFAESFPQIGEPAMLLETLGPFAVGVSVEVDQDQLIVADVHALITACRDGD